MTLCTRALNLSYNYDIFIINLSLCNLSNPHLQFLTIDPINILKLDPSSMFMFFENELNLKLD
jgi:hypothetical protein